MTEAPQFTESEVSHGPSFRFFTDYGVYERGDITLVFVPAWTEALDTVERSRFGSNMVLFPELITVADVPVAQLRDRRTRADAQEAIDTLTFLSRDRHPDAIFVVSSPRYIKDEPKPYNGAFIIAEGQIIGIANKSLSARMEDEHFTMDPEQWPFVFGGRYGYFNL